MADKPAPCIHNTPVLKIALRDELHGIVYERFYSKHSESVGSVLQRNLAFQGYAYPGFTYRGVYYGYEPMAPRPKPGFVLNRSVVREHYELVNLLHNQSLAPCFHKEMDALLEAKEEIEREESPLVKGMLTGVLNSASAVDDYKRLLPDILHPSLDGVAARCSCAVQSLPDAEIDRLLAKHGRYINIIRQRQLIFLIAPP